MRVALNASDEERRDLERAWRQDGDEAAHARVLRARVQQGEVPFRHVQLASLMGHRAAQLLSPPAAEEWRRQPDQAAEWVRSSPLVMGARARGRWARGLEQVRRAHDVASFALPLYEVAFDPAPARDAPRFALAFVHGWLDSGAGPTQASTRAAMASLMPGLRGHLSMLARSSAWARNSLMGGAASFVAAGHPVLRSCMAAIHTCEAMHRLVFAAPRFTITDATVVSMSAGWAAADAALAINTSSADAWGAAMLLGEA